MGRGDAELASVFRKMLSSGVYLDLDPKNILRIDTGALPAVFLLTEDEAHAVDEAVANL